MNGILSHCQHPINSGVLDGYNNKIKVIKPIAYSFRDEAYHLLILPDGFPAIPG